MQTAQQSRTSPDTQPQSQVYIAGIGMLTPVGVNTAMTAASIQAGISQYAVSEYYTADDQPITMSCAPEELFTAMEIEIDEGKCYGEQYDHIIKMAILAIQEAVSQQSIKDPIPLILAMPEPHPDAGHIETKLLVKNLAMQDDIPISADQVRTIHTGRAAGIQALELAFRYLYEAGADFVLIGGSDSYLSYSRLDALDTERLNTPINMDSFVPGEGAGFLLLTRHAEHALIENEQCIVLHPPGITEEPGHINSEEPHLGEGLDQAFKLALNGHTGPGIDTIYASMNGERYWSKEYGVALIRNKDCFQEDHKIEHPADCYGDLGAATSPVLIGLAAANMLKQAKSTTSLIYSSSDSAWRGAVRLEKISLSSSKEEN